MRSTITATASLLRDARRLVNARTRRQFLVAREAIRFREHALTWTDSARGDYLLAALRRQAAFASQHFAFWRERFDAAGVRAPERIGPEEFALLPPLERSDLPVLFAEARALDRRGQGRVVRTGGSTGVPAELLKGPEELGWSESATDHFRGLLGLPRTPRTAYVWGHHLDPVARSSRRERLEDFLFQQHWVDIFRIDDASLRRADAELVRFRPELIVAYAAALDALAGAINPDGGERRDYPTRAIITGAEKLLPQHRARLEATFAAPVFEQYGGRDMGLIAHQLDPRGGPLTVDWAQMYVEPEDTAEESAILVTKLHADAMPVFRYRVGDLARFAKGSRPGHAALVLEEVTGRELNMLWRPDGSRVSGMLFPHLLKDFPLREFQVRQEESLAVSVLIVPRDGFDLRHETEIRTIITDNLPGCPVRLERVSEVPRGANRKLHPVIAPARIHRAPAA